VKKIREIYFPNKNFWKKKAQKVTLELKGVHVVIREFSDSFISLENQSAAVKIQDLDRQMAFWLDKHCLPQHMVLILFHFTSQCPHISFSLSLFYIIVIFKQLQCLRMTQKPPGTARHTPAIVQIPPTAGHCALRSRMRAYWATEPKLPELKNIRNPNHFVKMIKILKLFGHRHFFEK